MNEIMYDEETSLPSRIAPERKLPTMVRWLLKRGVKDERTANYILLGVAASCFILMLLFLSADTIIRPGQAIVYPAP